MCRLRTTIYTHQHATALINSWRSFQYSLLSFANVCDETTLSDDENYLRFWMTWKLTLRDPDILWILNSSSLVHRIEIYFLPLLGRGIGDRDARSLLVRLTADDGHSGAGMRGRARGSSRLAPIRRKLFVRLASALWAIMHARLRPNTKSFKRLLKIVSRFKPKTFLNDDN